MLKAFKMSIKFEGKESQFAIKKIIFNWEKEVWCVMINACWRINSVKNNKENHRENC